MLSPERTLPASWRPWLASCLFRMSCGLGRELRCNVVAREAAVPRTTRRGYSGPSSQTRLSQVDPLPTPFTLRLDDSDGDAMQKAKRLGIPESVLGRPGRRVDQVDKVDEVDVCMFVCSSHRELISRPSCTLTTATFGSKPSSSKTLTDILGFDD